MNILAHRLKKCREDIKKINSEYTQGFVADKVGVARTTYTAYEEPSTAVRRTTFTCSHLIVLSGCSG